MKRHTQLKRGGPIAAVNRKRKRKADARNFGPEAKAVRRMACLACGRSAPKMESGEHRSEAAHVLPRGMGAVKGGRFDLVPLCTTHHKLAGEAGTSQRIAFEDRHRLNLRAEADRIALEHQEPLGIRGLAQHWVANREAALEALAGCDGDRATERELFDWAFQGGGGPGEYEGEALLGWVRRFMARNHVAYVAARMRHGAEPGSPGLSATRDPLSRDVAVTLGFTDNPFESQRNTAVWEICELAGWPS